MLSKILFATAILFILYLFLICPRFRRRDKSFYSPDEPFAHRGLYGNGVPENSLVAFRAAVDAGFGIELDVQMTVDGVLVVFHDYDLERLTGKAGKLNQMRFSELRELCLEGTEEKIPSLDEVLTLVDGKVPLLVELKGENFKVAPLCSAVAERLDSYRGDYCIESFNPLQLRWFKKNRPGVVRGQLVTNAVKDYPQGNFLLRFLLSHLLLDAFSRPDFVAFNGMYRWEVSLLLCRKLFRARACVWTVRDEDKYRFALSCGVYPIFEHFCPEYTENVCEAQRKEEKTA